MEVAIIMFYGMVFRDKNDDSEMLLVVLKAMDIIKQTCEKKYFDI
jgi:hypothetical protein